MNCQIHPTQSTLRKKALETATGQSAVQIPDGLTSGDREAHAEPERQVDNHPAPPFCHRDSHDIPLADRRQPLSPPRPAIRSSVCRGVGEPRDNVPLLVTHTPEFDSIELCGILLGFDAVSQKMQVDLRQSMSSCDTMNHPSRLFIPCDQFLSNLKMLIALARRFQLTTSGHDVVSPRGSDGGRESGLIHDTGESPNPFLR